MTQCLHRSVGILLVVPFILLSALTAAAQPLEQFEHRLLQANPSIASARVITERARERGRAASAWQPPGVGIELNMLPPGEPDPTSKGETMVMFEQMVPLWGQNLAMARAMEAEEAVGRAEVDVRGSGLLSQLRVLYYTVWFVDRRLEVVALSRGLLESLRRVAETQYEVSRAPQTDLLALAVEAESTELERSDLLRWRKELEVEINALAALPLDSPIVASTSPPDRSLPPWDSLRALVSSNPDLQRMEAMATMNHLEADARLAMLDPMVMLRGGLAWMPQGHPLREAQVTEHGVQHGDGVMRWGLRLGAMITIPMAPWSRVGPEGEAEALRLDGRRNLIERDDMRIRMESMLRSNYLRAQRARSGLEFVLKTSIPLLEKRLDAAQAEYSNGRIAFSTLIEGYRALIRSHIDLAQRRLDYGTAFATIANITGIMP